MSEGSDMRESVSGKDNNQAYVHLVIVAVRLVVEPTVTR